MENRYIASTSDCIDMQSYGGKAYWLKWLYDHNIAIPQSFFIPVGNWQESEFCTQIKNSLNGLFRENENIAVRSSGTTEDGEHTSKAGNFKTFLNIDFNENLVMQKCKELQDDAIMQGARLGIVLQKMISAEFSGILFSSHPVSYSKDEAVIEYHKGTGNTLVSGTERYFQKVILQKQKEKTDFSDFPSELKDTIAELLQIGINIEKELYRPVDIEWCIEKQTGKLYILQSRPQTSVFFNKNELKKVSLNSLNNDKCLANLDKVKIRLEAEQKEIFISDAYIVNCNCTSDEFPYELENIALEKSKYCKSYNVVVILPKRIDGKIIREFVGRKSDAIQKITCNRYNFRTCSKYETIITALKDIYKQIAKHYWICTMIIQEIFDPEFTGIIKRNGTTSIIEITKGHFAAKGNVPMSTYIIEDGKVVYRKEEIQQHYYRIIEGQIIQQDLIKPQLLRLDDSDLLYIHNIFTPVMEEGSKNLEFGLLRVGEDLEPYLIDFTDEKAEEFSADDIYRGIVSSGKICGKLVRLTDDSDETIINEHGQSEIAESQDNTSPTIYYSSTPNISLKNLLGQKNIGFVFDRASLLCHFSILLREKLIPAVIRPQNLTLNIDAYYEIDTASTEIIKKISG